MALATLRTRHTSQPLRRWGSQRVPLIAAADAERGIIEYDITKAKPLEIAVVGGLVSGLVRARRSLKIPRTNKNNQFSFTTEPHN